MKKDNLDLFVEQLLSELDNVDDELAQKAVDNIAQFKRDFDSEAKSNDELAKERLFLNTFEKEVGDPEVIKQTLFRLKKNGKDINKVVDNSFELYKNVKDTIRNNAKDSLIKIKAPKDIEPEKSKLTTRKFVYDGPNVGGPANIDPEDIKYNQAISLTADNGDQYVLLPTDQMKDVYDRIKSYHYQNGVTPQRGMNRKNRFITQYGGATDQDRNDLQTDIVGNAHMISYNDYRNNYNLQKLLGDKLAQFYKDKNIKPEDQPLQPINTNLQTKHDLYNLALHNQEFRRGLTSLAGDERKQFIKDWLKKVKKSQSYADKELYPAAASIPRADDINDDKINKIYNYSNNLNSFKDKYASLNDLDKQLFDKMQKIVTNPRVTGSTKMSPKDLMLLMNNFKELSNSSNSAAEIRDNWDKLRWGDLNYHESFILDLVLSDSDLLTEGAIDYDQRVLFDNLIRSGVYFTPINDDGSNNFVGLSNLNLFEDHWEEIPIQGRNSAEIYKDWRTLVEKYWLNYYVPMVLDWLRGQGYLTTEVNVQDTINNLKSQIKDVFTFSNFYDYKERKEAIFKAATGQDLSQMIGISNLAKKKQNKESKYDEMISKILKDLIAE